MVIPSSLRETALSDLRRPHSYAFERVGFFAATAGSIRDGMVLLLVDYLSIPDDGYVADDNFGALLHAGAFRLARQRALSDGVSIVHAHLHDEPALPWFSRTDMHEMARFMPDFLKVRPSLPHAAVVFSIDRAAGLCWTSEAPEPIAITDVVFVGPRLEKSTHA
jgi:hypothetical protein